jgi:threonine synthase
VIDSTASPYKFLRSVVTAIQPELSGMSDFELIDELHRISGVEIPQAIEDIRTAPQLHSTVTEVADMPAEVLRWLGI